MAKTETDQKSDGAENALTKTSLVNANFNESSETVSTEGEITYAFTLFMKYGKLDITYIFVYFR